MSGLLMLLNWLSRAASSAMGGRAMRERGEQSDE